jgi:hypothetical protein
LTQIPQDYPAAPDRWPRARHTVRASGLPSSCVGSTPRSTDCR